MVQLWFMDDILDAPSAPHRLDDTLIPLEELAPVGVTYQQVDLATFEQHLSDFCEKRGYKCQDEIAISPALMPDLEKKLAIFFTEGDGYFTPCLLTSRHLHEDEEVRFVIEGGGYFDIRDKQDRWIRIAVAPGDLLVLPAGIYHRFILDENKYIKEAPKWTPINRPAEENAHRVKYLSTLSA